MRPGRKALGLTIFLVLLAGGVLGIACGSSSSSSATPTKAPQATAAPATSPTKAPQATGTAASQEASVTIKGFQFSPATVTTKVGGTVTWTNDDSTSHTVTADGGSFDSGNLSNGKTYSHTFDTAGTFSYHCSIHPNMKAQVVVEASGASSTIPGY